MNSNNGFKKDIVFDNETDITIDTLEYKTNLGDDFEEVFDESLEPGYQMNYEDVNIDENVETMDFKIEDEDGNTAVLEGLDVSGIKDMDTVYFIFTQDGNTISVGISE